MFRKGRIVGFILTGVFLWIVARNVNGAELAAAFAAADYRMVAPAALATFCGYLLRTARWQRIVRPVAPLPFGRAFGIVMMGFAANNLLPARLGEVVRAYMLRRHTGARKTYGMATIILERVCDGMVLILFLGVISALMPLPAWGQEVQSFSTVLFLGATLCIIVLLMQESLAVKIANAVFSVLPGRLSGPFLRAIEVFISGLHSLKSRRSLVFVILLSVAVWVFEAASYLMMITAFNVRLTPDTPLLAAGFLLVVVNLGIMVPSAPGYIATFQFFAYTALGVFGVPKETGLAVAILSHGMQWLLVTAIGAAYFLRENVTLRGIERQAESDTEDDAAPLPAGTDV
ncbi:MAG TPA: lysylphosphatidylglycerol synthase transmembrane domain-containing protein [Chloroflexota bacterium]